MELPEICLQHHGSAIPEPRSTWMCPASIPRIEPLAWERFYGDIRLDYCNLALQYEAGTVIMRKRADTHKITGAPEGVYRFWYAFSSFYTQLCSLFCFSQRKYCFTEWHKAPSLWAINVRNRLAEQKNATQCPQCIGKTLKLSHIGYGSWYTLGPASSDSQSQ